MRHLGSTWELVLRVVLSVCAVELITGCAYDGRKVESHGVARSELVHDGEWSVSTSVVAGSGAVTGTATFEGPAGQTRRMGMCLVQVYRTPDGNMTCHKADDCNSLSASLPPDNHPYCLPTRPGGPSHCHFRPGTPQTYCAGSPALGQAAIAPGTYRVEAAASAGSEWRASACFDGCVALPPIASPKVTVR